MQYTHKLGGLAAVAGGLSGPMLRHHTRGRQLATPVEPMATTRRTLLARTLGALPQSGEEVLGVNVNAA